MSSQPPFPPQPPQPPQGFPPQQPYPPQQYQGYPPNQGYPQQGYPPQQYPPQQYPPQPPPAQKSNALKWILIALGAVFVLAITVIGAGSYIAYRAVKSAGFDSDLMTKNPGLALARMAATFNPDAEVVSTDDRAGTITMRDKKDGKVVTLKFDPATKSMVVIGDDGKEASVSITGDGSNSGINIKGPDGNSVLSFGAGASSSLPSWVPAYPGAVLEGNMASDTNEGSSHTVTFKTKDSPEKVLDYFQAQLKGFNTVNVTKSPQGGLLVMSDSNEAHMLTIAVGTADGQTAGTISAVEKK